MLTPFLKFTKFGIYFGLYLLNIYIYIAFMQSKQLIWTRKHKHVFA